MKRYSFDDVYNDFFGVETKVDNKEETKENISMKDIFDKINELHITDESKDLLKRIIEYMRKYHEKIEENYITFNISIASTDTKEVDLIKDILAEAAKEYSYIDKDYSIDISLYKLEKVSDLGDYVNENGVILFKDLSALYLNDTKYQASFIHGLEESLGLNKITIISGSGDDINRFFEGNNLRDNYFTFNIETSSIDVQDVYQSVLNKVSLDDDKKVLLLDYITETFPKTNDSLTTYQDKLCKYISFNKDIPKLETEKTLEEVFKDLDELVGLEDIKKTLHELVDLISLKNKTKDKLSLSDINLHMVFLGNPGTGKTTVARMVANILYDLKYIKENKLIEVTSKDLVAEYVGQTAPKTNEVINRALGGVLFIDEAYALASSGDANSYNAEAIATLIAAMENHRDDLVVIFAGYTKEMNAFLDSNSGIVSRIGYTLEFKDYTEDELVKIFEGMTKKAGFIVTDKAILKLREVIKEYKDTKNFGNARFVRNVYEKTIIKHAANTKDNKSIKTLKTITDKDISVENLIKESI